jgi:hypothetical protein
MRRSMGAASFSAGGDQLQLLELLGEGTFGKVYKGELDWQTLYVDKGNRRLHACICGKGRAPLSRCTKVGWKDEASNWHRRKAESSVHVDKLMRVLCLMRLLALLLMDLLLPAGMWRGSTVAIKSMILPAKMSGAEKRERMAIMEAAISSVMNHPNIVQVRVGAVLQFHVVPEHVCSDSLPYGGHRGGYQQRDEPPRHRADGLAAQRNTAERMWCVHAHGTVTCKLSCRGRQLVHARQHWLY